MFPRRHRLLAGLALALALLPSGALAQVLTVAEARASLIGRWAGQLDADPANADNRLMKWPVALEIVDAGDGATFVERQTIRRGAESEGRLVTTMTMLDPDGVTEHRTQMTRGTTPEHSRLTLSLLAVADRTNWTLRGIENFVHDGRPLQSRTTTTRSGDALTIEFEVDPAGDEPPFGRVRWSLRRLPP